MMGDDRVVEKRVGDLEVWSATADKRLTDSERRHAESEKRMDDYRENMRRVWERMDAQRDGQIKTQTLVEVGNKKTDDLIVSFESFRTSEEKRRQAEADRAVQIQIANKNRQPQWWMIWATLVVALIGAGGFIERLIPMIGGKP